MRKSLALLFILILCTTFTWGQSNIKDPLAPLQGGEDIATAFVLSGPLPITTSGTTDGYVNDYNENCPYTFEDLAPDVVYQYTPLAAEIVDIDLCLSSFDTKVYVYENEYTPGNPFACNDDYYYEPGGPCTFNASKITGVLLTEGSTYYIVIDGYNENAFGDYVMTISSIASSLPQCESFPSYYWPLNWTEQLQGLITSSHWSVATTHNAGGSVNEAMADYYPEEGATQDDNDRLVSLPLNTIGLSSIHLSFHQMLDDYDADVNDVWIKVQSSADRTNWTDEWVYAGGLNNPIPAEVKELDITNNLGNTTWIAWTLSGNTYYINDWYVDDVCIALPCAANTWTGNVSTDWNEPGNWTCEVLPDQDISIIIPANPSGGRFPVISSGIVAECYDITVELPGTLTIQTGGFLNVRNP